jgi:hypothetical protein
VGYKALGVLLEDILARTYGEIIQERILDPLGMTKTDPVISHDTRRRLAVGYEAFYDDRPPPRERPLAPATWLEYRWGDGSVAATAKDMSTYLRMYLNRGLGPEEAILSQESIDLMMAPVIDAIEEERDISYGYGLDVEELEGRKIIGHGGGMVGYYAQILADMQDGLGVVVLANAPGSETHQIATYALDLLRAALHDDPLPSLPRVDLSLTDSAEDYVGKYQRQQCSPRSLTPGSRDAVIEAFWIRAADRRLLLEIQDESIQLEMREPDYFFADHPNFAPYLLRFGRHDDKVVEVCSGPDWYVNERYNGPQKFDSPSDWDAYPGHYRSHNPWDTNFRVVLRKGGLKLIYPSGKEEPLVPVGGGEFRVGANDVCPERIRFDVIVDGQALRANLSCAEYFRTSRF